MELVELSGDLGVALELSVDVEVGVGEAGVVCLSSSTRTVVD